MSNSVSCALNPSASSRTFDCGDVLITSDPEIASCDPETMSCRAEVSSCNPEIASCDAEPAEDLAVADLVRKTSVTTAPPLPSPAPPPAPAYGDSMVDDIAWACAGQAGALLGSAVLVAASAPTGPGVVGNAIIAVASAKMLADCINDEREALETAERISSISRDCEAEGGVVTGVEPLGNVTRVICQKAQGQQ